MTDFEIINEPNDRAVIGAGELYRVEIERNNGRNNFAWLELEGGLDGIALDVDDIAQLIEYLTAARNEVLAQRSGLSPMIGGK